MVVSSSTSSSSTVSTITFSGSGSQENSQSMVADVVFVIEASAHISPYVESLKTNYIIPSIEYFNGTSDDRGDFSCHENYSSTLYGMVTFMSMDCKPDSASFCYAPTSSSNTFLQYLDRIQFIGGAGDSSSHVVEGLCTAISLFDDFQNLREKCYKDKLQQDSSSGQNITSTKYCILICNSTPYLEPAYESPIYCGYTIDQLMNVIVEKNINFSVFSPRKMHFLYKLFESGGGNLLNALSKNYAKDRRHLVLLNGFHLQEKAISPISQPSSTEQQQLQDKSQQQGLKRPMSPNVTSNQQMLSNPNQMLANRSLTLNNPNVEQQQYGQHAQQLGPRQVGSPSISNPWANNGNKQVPSPSQMPVRTPQSVRQRAPTPQPTPNNQISMNSQQQSLPGLVSQQQQANTRPMGNPPNNVAPPPMPRTAVTTGGMRPQQSPFSNPQAPSPSQPQPSPLGGGMRGAVMSPLNSAPSPMSQLQQQQFIQQQQIQISQPGPQQQNVVVGNVGMNQQQMVTPSPMQSQQQQQANMMQSMPPGMLNQNQRTRIWSGLIEYTEKSQSTNSNSQKLKLECQITYQPNNNEPEFKAERWPTTLNLCTVTRNLMNRLSPIFKNNSYQVHFHFTNDSPDLQSLCKAMGNLSQVGCIQIPSPANIRIIIVFYIPEKKLFVGFIPHNQDEFMSSMKELVETHKKEQQVKQKMIMQHQQQMQQQQQQQQQQNSGPGQMISNQQSQQPTQTQNQIVHQIGGSNSQMPIQIIHTSSGHHGSNNGPQQTMIQTTNNNQTNQMFQVQVSTMANNLNQNNTMVPSSNNVQQQQQQQVTSMGQNNISNVNVLPTNVQMVNIQQSQQQKTFQMANQNVTIVTTSSGIPVSINSLVQQQGPNNPQMIQQQQQANAVPTLNVQQQFQMTQQMQQTNQSNQINIAGGPSAMMTIQQNPNTAIQAQQSQMLQNTLQQPNSAGVRHHLQQQLQQKQHIQQQPGNMNTQQINSNTVAVTPTATTNTTQLRHLLQQQQHMRTINPNQRMNLQQQQNLGNIPQQQIQPKIMLQQQQQPIQQLRFQQPPGPQQQQSNPQQRSSYFDDHIY